MTNKFLKYLGIAVILSFGSLFSKTAIDLSKLNSGISSQKVSNLNVLAIMVEFEEDTLDFTTGNGTFNSGYEYPDSLLLDAVDHNVEYFTDQLTYVKNYFQSVSDGNVVFDNITVLDTIITLNHPIWYYNQNHTDELLEEKLYEFYQSSWNKIASDSSIPFSSYDTFVIFHAGSGQEFSAGYDDTPFDIPSVFFSENDLMGQTVVAHDGTEINNCIILPESEWQISSDDWLYAGMGGISTLMFAHRLGIPNLYSSEDGKSCIGKFGLMDQGSGNFSGMMPASVSAWVKEQQGWVDIQDVTSSQNDIVVKADSTIYRVPINNDEYFLVENRTPTNYTMADSSIFGYDRDSLKVKFTVGKYGVEKYEIIDAGFKTLVSIQDNDYDFPLTYGFELEDGDPLSIRTGGILIWHIDKRKTTEYNIVNNTVNDDHDNRGVYLEEGDGSFDIGEDYWLFDAGYGTELGWYFDFFFGNNEMWLKYSNKDLDDVEFSGASYPRSDSNEGTDTGIRLFDFSGISRSMTFSYELENQMTGYPIESGLEDGRYYPFYISNQLHHLFYRNNGEFKVMTEDSLVYSDNTGITFSDKFEPICDDDVLKIVGSDSLAISYINIFNHITINIFTANKITGQMNPYARPTTDGLILDIGMGVNISEAKNIQDVAITEDGSSLNYVAAIKKDTLFVIDSSNNVFSSFHDDIESDSKVFFSGRAHDDIENILIVNETNILKFDLDGNLLETTELSNLALINDLDEDGNIDYLTTDDGIIEVYNEHGYMENGFPLDTRVDQINNIFTYETTDGKFCTFVDSAMNCGSYSFDGDYVRTENFTLGSDINDLGLLKADGQVCIYSYDKLGTLNVYPLNNGTIESYLLEQNGVIQLGSPITANSNSITDKKSVYNWPNPAKGSSTNFRFFLNEPSTVNISIYDLNGNRVKELSETFTASGDNFEIEWDVSSKSSGIYTAVLEFISGSKNEKYKVKVAIIK
jgi:M6 family metalloprotease-like protein